MKAKKAFTLVELLIVIAIIGVLAGMLIPMVSGAYTKARVTNSKTFLANMAAALERYHDEYGFYPEFLTKSARVNLDDSDNALRLFKVLTGKTPEDKYLSHGEAKELNRKRISFMDFSMNSIVQRDGKWKIVDSFENPNIYVCVAPEGSSFIKDGLPTRKDHVSNLDEVVPNPKTGLRAKVVLFTLKKDSEKDNVVDAEDVFTWF